MSQFSFPGSANIALKTQPQTSLPETRAHRSYYPI
jgi:hypothetical protein